MFSTGFGKELQRLCQSVAPEQKIGVTELIELYFGATQNYEIPWLSGVNGAMDILGFIQQSCELNEVTNFADYMQIMMRAESPLFLLLSSY